MFWSHKDASSAGVALAISYIHLGRFDPSLTAWTIMHEGYLAVLSLAGKEGSLDVVVAYLHAYDAETRLAQARSIHGYALRHTYSHTIIAGDMNFVKRDEDRQSLATGDVSLDLHLKTRTLELSICWRN